MPPAPDMDQQVHDAYVGAMSLVASVLPEATTAQLGGWFLYDAGVGNPDFNIAAVAGDPGQAVHALGAVEEWFDARRVEWCFKLRPGADARVVTALEGRAIEAERREPYMWRALDGMQEAPPPSLRIDRVHDKRGLAAYDSFDAARGRPPEWSVATAMLPVPGCSLWLGWEGEEPVARAMAVATGPVGMIHNVVVQERFRRRGYGRAITARAALACAEAGASSVCLGASRMGYPLYLGMGFEHRYDLATFTRVPAGNGAPAHAGDAGIVPPR